MINERKSLAKIITDSAIVGTIMHPSLSLLFCLRDSEPFLEKLTEYNTATYTIGFVGGSIIYEVGKKVYHTIKKK